MLCAMPRALSTSVQQLSALQQQQLVFETKLKWFSPVWSPPYLAGVNLISFTWAKAVRAGRPTQRILRNEKST